MSLYQAGLPNNQNTTSRVGDAGPRGRVDAFTYPPKSTYDALMAQKAYCMEKNGFMYTDKSFKDLPFTYVHDAWLIYKFWDGLTAKVERSNAMTNNLLRAKAAFIREASAFLIIPFGIQPNTDVRTPEKKKEDAARIVNLLNLDAIVGMSQTNTLEFWKALYFFESATRNKTGDAGFDFELAWNSLVEAADELPGRIQHFTKIVADTFIKPVVDTVGQGFGNFLTSFFKSIASPAGIVGAGVVGYVGYKIIKSKRGPIVSIGGRSKSPPKEKKKEVEKGI